METLNLYPHSNNELCEEDTGEDLQNVITVVELLYYYETGSHILPSLRHTSECLT